MNSKKIALVAFGSLVLLGGVAHAAFDGKGGRQGFHPARAETGFVRLLKLADADKDGKVTKEEADAGFTRIFDEIDADKDGALTPGELRTYTRARIEAFRQNNPPPQAEQAEQPQGEAAEAEATPPAAEGRAEARRSDGPRERGPRQEARRGDGPRGEWQRGDRQQARFHRAGGPAFGAAHLIRVADTDENGQISREEAKKLSDDLFARLDVNKDGVISVDDLPDRPFP